jgi:hypothetical protein
MFVSAHGKFPFEQILRTLGPVMRQRETESTTMTWATQSLAWCNETGFLVDI